MARSGVLILVLPCLLCVAKPSDARGLGGFLEALLARGLVRGAIIAGRSPKFYTRDVLTIEQLAMCIKKAAKLDGDSQQLEIVRTGVLASQSEIDLSSATVELQRTRVDHYSQKSVDAFNALIGRHNTLAINGKTKQANFNALVDAFNIEIGAYNAGCVKKYYADDLPDAQKLAAQP
jgi:hypothetical protein